MYNNSIHNIDHTNPSCTYIIDHIVNHKYDIIFMVYLYHINHISIIKIIFKKNIINCK